MRPGPLLAAAMAALLLPACASLPHATRATEGEPSRITYWPNDTWTPELRAAFYRSHEIQEWDKGCAKVAGRWMSYNDTAAYIRSVSPQEYERRQRIAASDAGMANKSLWLPFLAPLAVYLLDYPVSYPEQTTLKALTAAALGAGFGILGNLLFKEGVARHDRLTPVDFNRVLAEKTGSNGQ